MEGRGTGGTPWFLLIPPDVKSWIKPWLEGANVLRTPYVFSYGLTKREEIRQDSISRKEACLGSAMHSTGAPDLGPLHGMTV